MRISRAHRTAFIAAAVTTAFTLALSGAPSAGAATTPAEFQLTINTSANAAPLHTIRNADGTWTAWDQVPDMYANPVGTSSQTQAESGGELYYASEGSGQIQFLTRDATGTWTSPTGTTAPVPSTIQVGAGQTTVASLVGSAVLGSDFHLIALAANGDLYETIRHSDGTWTYWNDLYDANNNALGAIGTITDASVATTNGSDLQIAAVVGGKLYHSIRTTPTGTWTPWGDVFANSSNPGTATHVAIAGVDGALEVMVTVNSGNGLYHATRNSNGTWTVFGNVESETGFNPGTLTNLAMAATGDSSTSDVMEYALVNTSGTVYHGIRYTNGTWSAVGDVNTAVPGTGLTGQTPSSATAGGE
ncbi:hypothetical protein [Streptacidiphilus fuscans]|uniref:Uncharacterized protein n=1 Tax=Streptacidiphilus fuscans TaxID=2789292 RepID=A0A931B951_9ACTN|nr:hypothetical protein [Streptacidiphilus fuscans]MBF9069165.1 hypothetical protein [Streptacidiphilus fuscans]